LGVDEGQYNSEPSEAVRTLGRLQRGGLDQGGRTQRRLPKRDGRYKGNIKTTRKAMLRSNKSVGDKSGWTGPSGFWGAKRGKVKATQRRSPRTAKLELKLGGWKEQLTAGLH